MKTSMWLSGALVAAAIASFASERAEAAFTPPPDGFTVTGLTGLDGRTGCENGTLSIDSCDGVANAGNGNGASEGRELWYLGGLLNNAQGVAFQTAAANNNAGPFTERNNAPGGTGTATVSIGDYLIFKTGEGVSSTAPIWYFYQATQTNVGWQNWTGDARGLSHITTVPIPAALPLLGTGLLALWGIGRTRRQGLGDPVAA